MCDRRWRTGGHGVGTVVGQSGRRGRRPRRTAPRRGASCFTYFIELFSRRVRLACTQRHSAEQPDGRWWFGPRWGAQSGRDGHRETARTARPTLLWTLAVFCTGFGQQTRLWAVFVVIVYSSFMSTCGSCRADLFSLDRRSREQERFVRTAGLITAWSRDRTPSPRNVLLVPTGRCSEIVCGPDDGPIEVSVL